MTDISSFNTSLPTSPSSMLNQYKFDEEHDAKDIFITVDDPESHITALETFVTYRITTKTTRSEFDSSEYVVRRRYQDFLWLKGKLEEMHPALIVPPLPEKFVMKGMVERFYDDFIETRRRALLKFLNRIAEHPTLTFNEDFKIFLTAQTWELTSYKKQGPGLFTKMGETVRAVAATVRGVKNRPKEFIAIGDYVDFFSQNAEMLDKISQRIQREQKEYLDEMKEYGPIYTLWSASEEDLIDSLKGVASCIDKCCKATEELMAGHSENLNPVTHEYVLYAETLKAVLKRRDHLQTEYESKVDALANKKQNREALKEEIGKLEDKVECANSTLKADWERWKYHMKSDIKSTFFDMADRNVSYYEKCLAIWESFLVSQKNELLEKDIEDAS
ncbi:sorting nexin-7 isoform X2 [Latimeria chalumnae]|nr:PREDICTED: sorting nexin-7 isoform X2 [Latimeria chalumnae]XP_006005349.1 PREDICTED: sorting nexin-7 isoform X2 [Latimeria chalumnae]XP_014349559.1 PREDICTED: sorting nexin-7 isoform X2 [Latimeria chalumnae]|eukprot:XP_006005348.1 PREDICTED: sorting nexin-7 isoform X2 [Latimeria chalumnae]